MPGGVRMNHPKILISSNSGHRFQNQKKSQGTITPPSVGFGAGTDIVTGNKIAPAMSDDGKAVGRVISSLGPIVVVSPPGNVVMRGVATPVGRVMIPSMLEIRVLP